MSIVALCCLSVSGRSGGGVVVVVSGVRVAAWSADLVGFTGEAPGVF